MNQKLSKMVQLFNALKGTGKSVFYGDLLRADTGYIRSDIEIVMKRTAEQGQTVIVEQCKETGLTKLTF